MSSPTGLTSILLPKVQLASPEVTVIKQPYIIQEHESIVRPYPVAVKSVHYTSPIIAHAPAAAATSIVHHYSVPSTAFATSHHLVAAAPTIVI